ERMLAELSPRIRRDEASAGDWAALGGRVGEASYRAMLARLTPEPSSLPLAGRSAALRGSGARALARQISAFPSRLRRALPAYMRRFGRRWIESHHEYRGR